MELPDWLKVHDLMQTESAQEVMREHPEWSDEQVLEYLLKGRNE